MSSPREETLSRSDAGHAWTSRNEQLDGDTLSGQKVLVNDMSGASIHSVE